MSELRAALRLVAFATWTTAIFAGLVAARVLSLQPTARAAGTRARRRLFRVWARGTARIVGIAIETAGGPPRGPFFLVANHLSYLDVVVLAATVNADFVAKADVSRWPVVGALCRLVDTVFIDRSRKRDLLRVLDELERRLRSGASVVVFPEGTTSDGAGVLPFKSSLFELALRTGRPVHTAALTYATSPADAHPSHAVCWWGDMELAPHLLDVLRLRGVRAALDLAPAALSAPDRKRLAAAARVAVRRRFRPVSQEPMQGEIPCPRALA